MHHLSVWWQGIQFTLIGIGEILTSISSYELLYSQVPKDLRSVCQSLNLLTSAIGFMICGAINSLLSFWIPNSLDKGHLELVFFLVAALTVVAFLLVGRKREAKEELTLMARELELTETLLARNRRCDAPRARGNSSFMFPQALSRSTFSGRRGGKAARRRWT